MQIDKITIIDTFLYYFRIIMRLTKENVWIVNKRIDVLCYIFLKQGAHFDLLLRAMKLYFYSLFIFY